LTDNVQSDNIFAMNADLKEFAPDQGGQAPSFAPAVDIGRSAARPQSNGLSIRRGLMGLGVLIALVVLAYGVHWLLYGRFVISTDDAYLRADSVTVSPRVSGYIEALYVKENQKVEAGQPLLRIDTRSYGDAVAQNSAMVNARIADIRASENQILQQQAVVLQRKAELDGARANLQFSRDQAKRYATLREEGAETDERYAQSVNERNSREAAEASAVANVNVAERQLATLKSQVEQTRAQLDGARASANAAQMNLDDTLIRASVAGYVGDDSARVGQYVQPGTRLMSIVPVQSVYLVANFKETQLKRMRVGQPATIKLDALGGVEIPGRVESFAPGTGAQFALLPPENATGNFIKIVQRVPVRVHLMPPHDLADRLLPGLSVTVAVDTSERSGAAPPAAPAPGGPAP
jgi:membrane fusion protein, multidrug efflux system